MKNVLIITVLLIFIIACGRSATQNTTEAVNLVKVEINVKGMTCTGCEQTIIKGVKSINGVQEASASYVQGKAWVIYDEEKADMQQISEAIEKKGYEVANYKPFVNDSTITQ
jgi:copper chaperone CopZ